MKIKFVCLLLFYLILVFFACQGKHDPLKEKQFGSQVTLVSPKGLHIYEYRDSSGNSHFLYLTLSDDSIAGRYYGVYTAVDGTVYYFLSDLKEVLSDHENLIRFNLYDMRVSQQPFDFDGKSSYELAIEQIPFLLRTPWRFSGEIKDDRLDLRMTLDYWDSRADVMVFMMRR